MRTPLGPLLRRLRESEAGEAYASLARGVGYRIGVGARRSPRRSPRAFIEVLLDPVPHRPEVDLPRLARSAVLVTALKARGYSVACDDHGTVACERTLDLPHVARELRSVRRLLRTLRTKDRSVHHLDGEDCARVD